VKGFPTRRQGHREKWETSGSNDIIMRFSSSSLRLRASLYKFSHPQFGRTSKPQRKAAQTAVHLPKFRQVKLEDLVTKALE
jgi:hypothetical protein